jgi:Family of unknown function (DUF6163)
MKDDSVPTFHQSLASRAFPFFLRGVAIACLYYALEYWSMVIGYSGKGAMRFDLMNTPWKVAAASLSVLYPVAALGLWLTVSWGSVVWVLAAATEATMYLCWSEIFGTKDLRLISHLAIAVLYIAFRLVLWWQEKARRALEGR